MIDKNASGDVKNFPAYLIFLYITGNGTPLPKLDIPMVFVTVYLVYRITGQVLKYII